MDAGRHIWFGHDVIQGEVANMHLGDFPCLGTHKLDSSDKCRQHIYANGYMGQVQDYTAHDFCQFISTTVVIDWIKCETNANQMPLYY